MKKFFYLILALCSITASAQQTITRADSLLLNADYEKALEWIEQNLKSATNLEEIALLEDRKAEALIHLGKFDEAEQMLKVAGSERSNNLLSAITATNYGLLYLMQGRNDRAVESLQEALTWFDKDGKSGTLEAAQALSHLGLAYNAAGKTMQAEEQLQMALTIRQGKLSGDHELLAASYNDLGLVYFQIDKDKAIDYYEKALAIYQRLHGNDHPKIAYANINTAILYRSLKLYGDAITNFETALAIWEKVYKQPHPTKAFVLFNLGETYNVMGDQKAARGYYERSLKLYQESYGTKHPDISRVLNALGSLEINAGNFDAGISLLQEALIANVSDFSSKDVTINPSLRNYYHGSVLLYSLLFKARAFESRHFGKSLKFSDLEQSLTTLQYCDSLIDKLRQQSTNETDKIALGTIANEAYADGVRIAYQAAQVALKKKPLLEQAFYFAEKSKSAVLLEAISDSNAKSFAGIPQNLLDEEQNLKSAIALTAQKLSQKPSAEEEKYLRETSFNLNRSYEAFTKRLEKEFPQYYNLKFNSSTPSVTELQRQLKAGTAMLSYFIDERNNSLYVFFISKDKFNITDHNLPAEFDKYITGMRNGLFYNEIKTYKLSAEKLSKLLLPTRIPSPINNLVILPTGRLSIIPFEALFYQNLNKDISSYQALPYLVRRYSTQYEFSAALLQQKAQNKRPDEAPAIFLCAPVTFPQNDQLSALPGTESEVKEIASLFASKNLTASVHLRQQANETTIKDNTLKKHNLLHFATHGVVDESNPELSRIFLQSSTQAEDGNLFAGEIYNLQLDADLVALSACQTGLGKISKGEGVIGLSRALVYAGARNIIVSFWSVADESTAELMTDFYKQYLSDTNAGYSKSLQQAKLHLINNKKFAAPYYWAPFILIGF